jgi:hypothetical protein
LHISAAWLDTAHPLIISVAFRNAIAVRQHNTERKFRLMKGYKNISNNIKNSNNTQSNHKGTRTSSYHRSDQSRKEQKSELIKKYLDSHAPR